MDRPFLDANILFSAAHRDRAPMLRLWRLGGVTLLTSDYAVGEARRNLAADRRPVLDRLLATVELVPTPPPGDWQIPTDVVLPDKDRPILAAAINAGATHLITGDSRHFGAYYGRTIGGVLVLPPSAYPIAGSGSQSG